jgi:hypothetical protein
MTVVNSTAVITDLKTLRTNPFTTASDTRSDCDLTGMASAALKSAEECKRALQLIAANCDSADPQLAAVANIIATLS